MSRFFSERYAALIPYTPGEQPQERKYIKLNTNESPFPPSPGVTAAVEEETKRLQLYSDPESKAVTCALAEHYHLQSNQILVGNGSDELFCELNRIPYIEIPLTDDLKIEPADYLNRDGTVFIANPNAPTGLALSKGNIEDMLKARPDRVHVIDEAYVDFGAESVLPLVDRYENLLVVQTFSKSRSMAGARLGFAAGSDALIHDLNTLKYSTNPYNVNRMTSAAGVAALRENAYYREKAGIIVENRSWTTAQLRKLGFEVTDSASNFLFARTDRISGGELYRSLKERGILVRHFEKPKIDDYVRITVGTKEQMEALICETKIILGDDAV